VISLHQFKSLGQSRTRRLVTVLLLAFVSWGATAEITHHHGGARPSDSVANFNSSEPTLDASSFESSDKQTTSSSSKSRAECLICQLHQNLSTTLVCQAPGMAASKAKIFPAPMSLTLRLSEYRSDRSGRAPPSII
jgi:hypothetical protein